jgi:UDP-4-amino-4-deoxy-L-arabinose formyltransferase/UDP-glucuronic acid dehydrogenase (UDP-4-keto-hexauronic acid decarboxylating)
VKVLLAAQEAAGVQALRLLASRGYEVEAVLSSAAPDARRGAGPAELAQKLGLALWPAERVKDPALAGEIGRRGVDLLLNVHSLFVVHRDVVAAPRIGSFNLHPGPLPRYAGLNAPSWALYEREPRHAVTLHWMEPGIDTGAIAFEAWFDLSADDTGLSVSARCVREGIPLVEQLLAIASRDPAAIPARPQDARQRRVYRRREVPHGGRVPWSESAQTLHAFVRAADFHPLPSPWGHPATALEGVEIGVVKTELTRRPAAAAPGTVGARADAAVEVATGDEWLRVSLVHAEGRYWKAAERIPLGARLV